MKIYKYTDFNVAPNLKFFIILCMTYTYIIVKLNIIDGLFVVVCLLSAFWSISFGEFELKGD